MRDDFEMVIKKFGRDVDKINLYGLFDAHIGSPEDDMELLERFRDVMLNDPFGYLFVGGDLVNNGLKTSKSNSYEERLRPRLQKEVLYDYLKPIAKEDRLLGATNGNHEWRSLLVGDDCPVYDVMCRLGLEDVYRENLLFSKVVLGEKNRDRQFAYSVVVGHGASKGKTDKFAYDLDNCDVFMHGHTHNPDNNFPMKYVIDMHNECVRERDMLNITYPSLTKSGGYGLRNMYQPVTHTRIPIVTLYGDRKESELRWMQI